ncbi:MAG: AAA family ATPase [Thermoleophilaceae bacterium]
MQWRRRQLGRTRPLLSTQNEGCLERCEEGRAAAIRLPVRDRAANLTPRDPPSNSQSRTVATERPIFSAATPLGVQHSRATAALIGRERELATIESALARLGQGRGACLSYTGEPGIGKTRLLRELIGRARGSDSCSPGGAPSSSRRCRSPLPSTRSTPVWARCPTDRRRAGRLDRLSAVAPSVRSDAAFVEHLRESQHAP